jgi:hypothetical protein
LWVFLFYGKKQKALFAFGIKLKIKQAIA